MERGMISVLDLQTGDAWLDVARGVDVETGKSAIDRVKALPGKVAQTGRPMAIANLGKEAHFLDRTGSAKSLNRAELAFLCVPIFYQGRCVGIFPRTSLLTRSRRSARKLAIFERGCGVARQGRLFPRGRRGEQPLAGHARRGQTPDHEHNRQIQGNP